MRALHRLLAGGIPQAGRATDSIIEQCLQSSTPSSLVITQSIVSLRPLQFIANFSAYKRPPPEDEADDAEAIRKEARKGHLPRVSGAALRNRVFSSELEDTITNERRAKIQQLVQTFSSSQETAGASKFLEEFFQPEDTDDSTPTTIPTPGYSIAIPDDPSSLPSDSIDEFEIATPDPLSSEQESHVLAELRGLRRGSQRIVLQKLLQGGMLRADPSAMAEWKQIQQAFNPPEGFRMKVVDVNRTCKGTRSGGLYRFSAMVVVGNGEGVLGWGQGKAAEVNDAVRKAYQRACRNLYPIPRYNGHTIPEPAEATFGKVKIVMYPKSSGRGIVASGLIFEVCKLAGIHDVGVKIHGSRNPRNTIKCLFEAFDKMKNYEEIIGLKSSGEHAGPALQAYERKLLARKRTFSGVKKNKKDASKDQPVVTLLVPPGRFGRLANYTVL